MGLAGMVNETLDRQLLKFWLPAGFYPGHDNDAAVGIYSAGYKLSIFISLAIQAFRYSAEPFFFAQSADKNSPPLFAKVMHYFVILLLGMGLAVVANLDWLGQVFLRGRAYRESLDMVPILLMANILLGVYYNLTVWFKITDRTQYGLWFTLAGAGVTVLANWLLIPQLGYFGSAWGHLLCYLTLCGLCYFYGQRFYPIPYRWGAALGYLLLALALGAAAWLVTTGHPAADFLLRNLAVLAFGAVVFWRERAGLRGVKA
jgi:O-antigen/teichoic acid export membrane protein